MRHLRKAAALLLTVLILVFVVPRFMPTTSALESYGFYPKRNSESTKVWASQPLQYTDTTSCSTCHTDRNATLAKSKHSGVSCETCHGPAQAHVEKGVALVVDSAREACGVCHSKVVARPASFPQIDLEQHGGKSTCVTCHNPHDPQVKAQPAAIPHIAEGRADCLLCHSAGGLKPFSKDHEGRNSSTCLNCHRSK